MSLVAAYGSSSDEDSEYEENEENYEKSKENKTSVAAKNGIEMLKTKISEDGEQYEEFKINLPQPKTTQNTRIVEEDDEFLHKKVQQSLIEKPKSLPPPRRQPVKITIPSLADLEDGVYRKPEKLVTVPQSLSKSSGLLSMLPVPKFGSIKTTSTKTLSTSKPTTTISLVPRTVVAKAKNDAKLKAQAGVEVNPFSTTVNDGSDDSDHEGNENGDFFSLNDDEKLPEVNASEISAMVSKKAANIAKFANDLKHTSIVNTMESIKDVEGTSKDFGQQSSISKLVRNTAEEDVNLQALVGARAAKRARKEDIEFIEISQDQVTMNHDEWIQSHLAQQTEYQPTGKLNITDPGSGTKKKHQITYLAYQAKANEQELQAMWAANRHTRRQTQSKYGF